MSSQSIKLLETVFSSSMTMPPYLQYGKELFASWLWHTPLTDLPDPDQSTKPPSLGFSKPADT